jgi:glycosyltransferase involved in cell wall biosynthesis
MKKQILFIAPIKAAFVLQDQKMLSEVYDVQSKIYDWNKKERTIYYMIRLFMSITKNRKVIDAIFISFGGYWSMISVLAGKMYSIPTLIVLNGTDSVSIPQLSYGSLRKPLLKMACYISYKYASILLPVSKSLLYFENKYSFSNPVKYGLNFHFPQNNFKSKVVANGLNTDFWNPNPSSEKQTKSIVSVISEGQHQLKGLPLIMEAAIELDDCVFYIAGSAKPANCDVNNVKFLGKLSSDQLLELYSACNVYLQLSNFEGFGMSLCEAMLCKCIPIVSNVNMLPEIIGETGHVLESPNKEGLCKFIRQVVNQESDDRGNMARKRILENYGIELRKKELCNAIDDLILN